MKMENTKNFSVNPIVKMKEMSKKWYFRLQIILNFYLKERLEIVLD